MNEYQTYLSLHFADVYLYMKDTLRAMNRLFRYMMRSDGPYEEVARKLKTLLLTKYSNREVQKQIEQSIRNLKKTGKYPDAYGILNLLNLTPQKVWIREDEPLDSVKAGLRMDPGLRILYHYMPEHHIPPSYTTSGPWYPINFFSLFSQHEAEKIF